MRKSFAKVKRFINTRQSSEQSQVNSSRLQGLREAKIVSSVPQLVLQNESLKQRISLLEKEKEVVQRSLQSRSFGQDESFIYKVIAAEESSRTYKSLERQNYRRSQNFNSKRQSPDNSYRIRINHNISKNNTRVEMNQVSESLEAQRLKNRKLQLRIQRLNYTIEKQDKQKQSMLAVIEQMRQKLKQSTEYLMKLEKLPNPEQHEAYLKKLENQIVEKQQTSFRVSQIQGLSESTILSSKILKTEVQKYRLRLSDYVKVKQQNCYLRDRLAWLALSNKKLQQKVITSSKAIDHLWKIKEIQIQNLNLCLKQVKQ